MPLWAGFRLATNNGEGKVRISIFGSSDDRAEKERAAQAAARFGNVGDRDALAETPAVTPVHAVTEGGPQLPDAPTSAAGLTVAALLDAGLSAADVEKLLAAETARRAAIAEQQARARQAALESAGARSERQRMAAEYARLTPELDALVREIAQAVAQFDDQRDALLSLAGQINALTIQHNRLYGRIQSVDGHPFGEAAPWQRPHRWNERAHGVTLATLEHAGA